MKHSTLLFMVAMATIILMDICGFFNRRPTYISLPKNYEAILNGDKLIMTQVNDTLFLDFSGKGKLVIVKLQ